MHLQHTAHARQFKVSTVLIDDFPRLVHTYQSWHLVAYSIEKLPVILSILRENFRFQDLLRLIWFFIDKWMDESLLFPFTLVLTRFLESLELAILLFASNSVQLLPTGTHLEHLLVLVA